MNKKVIFISGFWFVLCFFFCTSNVLAATLRVSPDTGIYTVQKAFTVSIFLNTDGKMVNAADGQLSFNPRELQVVSLNRANSIFNLWTEEPTFSNSAGTISFGGGLPTGYKGSNALIISVAFKPLSAGTPKLTFKGGSVLAADGLGTNILTGMNSGSYTVAAVSDSPAPEYIPPANTPSAPKVTSSTHTDESMWYKEKTVNVSWDIPSEVTGIRMLLDNIPGTIPTIVYDTLITKKEITDLSQGISYFHIQFKNSNGWGRTTHFKIAVDSEAPQGFHIREVENTDPHNPRKVLSFESEDISPILEYKIQIDGMSPFTYKDEHLEKKYTLEQLAPGYHTITVEAFDSAGNTSIASNSFTIEAFEKPIFIDYPTRINTEVIPAIKGTTVPHAKVAIIIRQSENETNFEVTPEIFDGRHTIVTSDAQGMFIYVPDTSFARGVYILNAVAEDTYGRMSEASDEIKIIVDAPGYLRIGTFIINVLSVIIPVIALFILFIFGTWFLWYRLRRWKRRVHKETIEAEDRLALDFSTILKNLNRNITVLKESRKGKLSKQEMILIDEIERDLHNAQSSIGKEIEDIEDLT